MKAARIHRFGPPDVIQIDEITRPVPGPGEVLVRVAYAGVGPWDALIREHKSVVSVELPITLGSDHAGIVEALGPGVTEFVAGEAVYGATNPNFIGAYAEFAVVEAGKIARKPDSLSFAQAASAPVVAVTAWQMIFEHAEASAGQKVLILGAGGNVGAYAVQFAARAGLRVYATASARDLDYVRGCGAGVVIDYKTQRFEDVAPEVDFVLDLVGGEPAERSMKLIKRGGILVSAVRLPPEPANYEIRTAFFLVDVTTQRLDTLTNLFDSSRLVSRVGAVLPLADVRTAHEMLAGAPHEPGKIVLQISDLVSEGAGT
jgi:NADPH:quinone reductase-like Zn-dependent oxidoreductase